MVQSLPASREDVLRIPDSPVVHRFLFGVAGLSCVERVDYVVSFGDGLGWAHGWGTLRDVAATFDVTPFDEVLLRSDWPTSHDWILKSLRRGLHINPTVRPARQSRSLFSTPKPL